MKLIIDVVASDSVWISLSVGNIQLLIVETTSITSAVASRLITPRITGDTFSLSENWNFTESKERIKTDEDSNHQENSEGNE